MKKIFPIITILVFISALGLIFFQITWIEQALQDKKIQFEEKVSMVTTAAAQDLIAERAKVSPFDNRKNGDLLFPLNIFPTTIAHKFTREEIRERINKAFEKNGINGIDFEFAITTTSMIGDDLQSKHFYETYTDTANHNSFVIPLDPPGGSMAEGLVPQELLVIVVPRNNEVI